MANQQNTGRRRKRRSPEEMIEDLQSQIADLKARAEARQLKGSAAIKAALSAVKAIDKGVRAAVDEDDAKLRHVLLDARAPLAQHLEGLGMKLPKMRRPKGPRPK